MGSDWICYPPLFKSSHQSRCIVLCPLFVRRRSVSVYPQCYLVVWSESPLLFFLVFFRLFLLVRSSLLLLILPDHTEQQWSSVQESYSNGLVLHLW